MKYADYSSLYHQYNKPASTIFHRYVSKKIGKAAGYICLEVGITPNMITTLTLLLVVLSGLIISIKNSNFYILTAFILLQVSYGLDCVDGVIARITKCSSAFGEYFDILIDRFNNIFIFICIGYSDFIDKDKQSLSIYTLCCSMMLLYSLASTFRKYIFNQKVDFKKIRSSSKGFLQIGKIVYEFIDTGTVYFFIFLGLLMDLVLQIFIIYGAVFCIMNVSMTILLYKHQYNKIG
jgi:phosphatidylglycerophosphate synthase